MNDNSPVLRSLAMIEERIRERLTVETLAADIHFSKYHYQRLFREVVGETVMGYVTRRRMSLAAGELAGTKDSVLEIALRYGYDSHEGFTRSFKAHTGVTPAAYRKYHSSIHFPERNKEKGTMVYSKHTDELMKELNSLIVQARETAAETKKYREIDAPAAGFYGQFWALAAGRAEKTAEDLGEILERVGRGPRDEISARLLLVKAIDNTAFEAELTAFHVGLMIARAMPEHQAMFRPLCARYDSLAENARMKAGRMADFLRELSELVLQDMREQAKRQIQSAVESGRAAAETLSDPALPYGYIAEGIADITETLDALAVEDITVSSLTDAVSALEAIRFAAHMDILRAPQDRQLFDGIANFREKLDEAVAFFQDLAGDGLRTSREADGNRSLMDLAAQEEVALFCLKGEIQKLGDARLDTGQRSAFSAICGKIDAEVKLSRGPVDEEEKGRIAELLGEAYDALTKEADQLGPYGGAIRYLAEKVNAPLQYLMVE